MFFKGQFKNKPFLEQFTDEWYWSCVQGAMTTAQVKDAEQISNTLAQSKKTVHTKVVSLAQAKAVQGLRAVFDEVGAILFSA